MTVTTGYFDSVSASGSGSSWQDLNNLKSGLAAYAFHSFSAPASNPQDVYLSEMGEIDNVPNGSQFEEMEVTFRDKAEGFSGLMYIRWTGTIAGVSVTGTSFNHPASLGAYTARTYSGDASYWGLTGFTPAQIFTAIRDGALKLKYSVSSGGTWGGSDEAYLDDMELSITYTEVDTKRGAILTCVP